MTKREMFEAIVNGNVTDEVVEMAKAEIEKMNVRNAKRAERPSKKAIANEPIKAKIADFLADREPTVASEIANALELTVQKVSALCRQMTEAEVLSSTDVKVKGKGTQKAYSIA